MRSALLVVILIVIAIRCVPGRVGILDVGQIVPPMPLKTTPEGYDAAPAPRPSFTETPRLTPTPSPTPSDSLKPEPIVEPVPLRSDP